MTMIVTFKIEAKNDLLDVKMTGYPEGQVDQAERDFTRMLKELVTCLVEQMKQGNI